MINVIFFKFSLAMFSLQFTFFLDLTAYTNLEKMEQDFVLETKKIDIPGYPSGFNPSIIRWKDSILMSFRARDPITGSPHLIGFVWLDEDFNLMSEPKLLDVGEINPYFPEKLQDVRLISVEGELYAVFNNVIGPMRFEIRRMFIAKMRMDESRFYIESLDALLNFEGEGKSPREKNWTPFEYEGKILLAYSLEPHIILQPFQGASFCKTIAKTWSGIQWDWGQLRGGTQALREGDEYLSFFHSSKEMSTLQSDGKKISHYFIGAYLFAGEPPFNITKMSSEPIIAENFYNGPKYQTWKPLLAIFPCGYIKDENYVWISYGRQDNELWIVKLDKKGLINSLTYANQYQIKQLH